MKRLLFISVITAILFPFILTAQSDRSADEDLTLRLKNHVRFLAADSLEGRGLGTRGKIIARDYIADQFREAGLKPYNDDSYFQHFELRSSRPIINVQASNVVGYIEGSDPQLRQEFIVVGAHYDHIGYVMRGGEKVVYPGADDNASGTATVIELARYFAENSNKLGRSVIFIAFDAEESGLLGAGVFVRGNRIADSRQIKSMFSIDMVGMYESHNGLTLQGISTLEGGLELAIGISSLHGVPLINTDHKIAARTDTKPFGDAGIPAIYVSTGLDSPYHKPEDTYDLLDYDGMALANLYMRDLIAEMSQMSAMESTHRFERQQGPVRLHAGIIGNFGGTKHLYPDEYFNAKSVAGFSGGLFMQFKSRRMTLQPEVLYDYQGSRTDAGKFRRHSITVPLNLQFHFPSQQPDMIRVYTFTGLYYRYSFSGNEAGTSLDFETRYNRSELGFSTGIGAEIIRVQVAYTHRRSAGTITQASATDIRQAGNYFTIGFRF